MAEVDLNQLRPGEKGVVTRLLGGYGLVRKLEALGIRPSIEIIKVSSQFMRGPVVAQVGNTQVAIGFGMARKVMVEKIETRSQRSETKKDDKEL